MNPSNGSLETLHAPSTDDRAKIAGSFAFFFLGNCQLQFYASHLASVVAEQVFCSGRAQVPLYSVPPVFLRSAEQFFAEARRRKLAGGRNFLVLQETARGQFTTIFKPHRAANFDAIVRFPYFHFRSVWPNFRLKVPGNFTPRSVSRLFAAERLEFESTLERCGSSDFDAEGYWRTALEKLAFYHPGHTNAEVLLNIYDSFLHRPLMEVAGARASAFRDSIASSPGIPQTCMHPIELQWGDAVGTEWHRRPAYQAWVSLSSAASLQEIRALDGARYEISREFGDTAGALFGDDLAARYLQFGALAEAAENSAAAAVLLPGVGKTLSKALVTNSRIRAWPVVEAVLGASLPYLHPGTATEARVSKWLSTYSGHSEVKTIVHRLSNQHLHSSWLASLADTEQSLAPI